MRLEEQGLTDLEKKAVLHLIGRFGVRRISEAAQIASTSLVRVREGKRLRPGTARNLKRWLAELGLAPSSTDETDGIRGGISVAQAAA